MQSRPVPPHDLLQTFEARDPHLVAETALACVWRVRITGGENAALKLYHDKDMQGEERGADMLRAWDGSGAVRLLATASGAMLTEWLDGPLLGDLTRTGRDAEATEILANVAGRLRSEISSIPGNLPRLNEWFSALFTLDLRKLGSDSAQQDIAAAQELARRLLATETAPRPLHGDLHHDNIAMGQRGWCAFDPKGVCAEAAFEMANAFRNPNGAPDAAWKSARITGMAETFATRLEFDRRRLLQWAAVRCALSICWTMEDGGNPESDLKLLPVLLTTNKIK